MAEHKEFWEGFERASARMKKKYIFRAPPHAATVVRLRDLEAPRKNDATAVYSAFCALAAARCEHAQSLANEASCSFVSAGNCFWACEQNQRFVRFTGFGEYCTEALQCYDRAIHLMQSSKHTAYAAAITYEAALALSELGRPHDAIEYFLRTTALIDRLEPMTAACALSDALDAAIANADLKRAVRVAEALAGVLPVVEKKCQIHDTIVLDVYLALVFLNLLQGSFRAALAVVAELRRQRPCAGIDVLEDFVIAVNEREMDALHSLTCDVYSVCSLRLHPLISLALDRCEHAAQHL